MIVLGGFSGPVVSIRHNIILRGNTNQPSREAAFAGSALLATLGAATPSWLVAACGAIFGSVGLAMPAMASVALSATAPDRAGLGSVVLNAARQTGGAFGVALLGSVLESPTGLPTLHIAMPLAALGYGLAIMITIRLGR